MNRNIVLSTLVLLAGSLLAADNPKDEVTNAAKALANKSNYSWKQTIEVAGVQGFRPGPTEGKTEKDGYTCLSLSMRDNKVEVVMKGEKAVMKTDAGWEAVAEGSANGTGQGGPAIFLGRMVRNYKTPAVQAQDLVGQVAELKKDGDVYSGDLTEDGAKSLLRFGRRGGNGPEISDAKASVKFWITDGVLAKYEFKVQGKMSFNGNERDIDRTTTVEIKDVGSTKIDVPEEASSKL
jgi:hypothetical protein